MLGNKAMGGCGGDDNHNRGGQVAFRRCHRRAAGHNRDGEHDKGDEKDKGGALGPVRALQHNRDGLFADVHLTGALTTGTAKVSHHATHACRDRLDVVYSNSLTGPECTGDEAEAGAEVTFQRDYFFPPFAFWV